jgi:hypothetical protein
MKRFLSILLLATGITATAQDRLEPYRECTKEDRLCSIFYEQVLWRLLNPKNAEWGVFRDIELMTEASLTYDAASHSLVFVEIDGILWSDVCDATTKRIDKGNTRWYKDLKKVKKSYKAPGTKSTALAIPDSIAEKLKALWIAAVSTPEENDLNCLGGVSWNFFVGGKRAVGHGEAEDWTRVPRLKKLAANLIKAVQEQDSNMLLQQEQEIDELIAEFSK